MTGQSSSEIRRLEVLGAVIGVVDEGASQATAGQLMQAPEDEAERAALSADVRALGDRGWLSVDERFSGAWTARPTQAGRDQWNDFCAKRAAPLARRKRLRNQYLTWLYERTRLDGSPTPDEFLEEEPNFLGVPFTDAELQEAGKWLADNAFISGPGVWQRSDPIRPRMTAKGEHYVEEEIDVHTSPTQPGTTNFTFNAPAQVANNSHHVQQTQNIVDVDRAADIARLLREFANSLPSEDSQTDLRQVADELEEEARGDGRPTKLRVIAQRAGKLVSTAAGSAIGAVISAQLTDFLSSLPH